MTGNPVLGTIGMFAGNFAPRGWAFCNGQLLSINSNESLFSILGTNYGGDGRSTFGLPDLRGRVSVHAGDSIGPGLSNRPLGQRAGSETNTLSVSNLPPHSHTVQGTEQAQGSGNASIVTEKANTAQTTMTTNDAGGGQPINNMQPYLAVNFCIALEGIYPPRS